MVSRRRPEPAACSPAQAEAGYNLVILVVMITVMNIVISKALPLWSAVIQREKEEELIFRGMQYAEAIRIYEQRTGGLPTKLEQLIEIKPRCIRQLWKNPVAQDGSWELILPGQGRQRPDGRNQPPLPDREADRQRDQDRDSDEDSDGNPRLQRDPNKPDPSLLWIPDGENEIAAAPIFGVKSSVAGTSIKTFVTNPNAPGGGGSNEYREWHFTVDIAKALIAPQVDPSKPPPSMNVEQRFKPWPPNVRPINNFGSGPQPGQPGQRGQRGQRGPDLRRPPSGDN